MDGPGTITWEEFVKDSEKFVELSNKFMDSWEFLGDKVNFVFIKKKAKIFSINTSTN